MVSFNEFQGTRQSEDAYDQVMQEELLDDCMLEEENKIVRSLATANSIGVQGTHQAPQESKIGQGMASTNPKECWRRKKSITERCQRLRKQAVWWCKGLVLNNMLKNKLQTGQKGKAPRKKTRNGLNTTAHEKPSQEIKMMIDRESEQLA